MNAVVWASMSDLSVLRVFLRLKHSLASSGPLNALKPVWSFGAVTQTDFEPSKENHSSLT
jgi:hypothetical protein